MMERQVDLKRSWAVGVLIWALSAAMPLRAAAAELVMFEQRGCVWCAKWRDEIGPAYPKTEEGQRAPLRRVDIHEPIPEDLAHLTVERYTPVFVLVEEGEEIGRIRGYPGDEFFWFRLDELLSKLEEKTAG